jgi:hypothetical protein
MTGHWAHGSIGGHDGTSSLRRFGIAYSPWGYHLATPLLNAIMIHHPARIFLKTLHHDPTDAYHETIDGKSYPPAPIFSL